MTSVNTYELHFETFYGFRLWKKNMTWAADLPEDGYRAVMCPTSIVICGHFGIFGPKMADFLLVFGPKNDLSWV